MRNAGLEEAQSGIKTASAGDRGSIPGLGREFCMLRAS